MLSDSLVLNQLVHHYLHLRLGHHTVACPYWMDKNTKSYFGIGGGKLLPEVIEEQTTRLAQQQGINLDQFTREELVHFMKINRIGIDCSGYAFCLLDAYDRENGGDGIADDIPNSQGCFVVRASVRMLTDPLVAYPIPFVNQLQPGDLIRLNNGRHVIVILNRPALYDNRLQVSYTHSSRGVGVHTAVLNITFPKGAIQEQDWQEITVFGKNYRELILPQLGDGIWRLKHFADYLSSSSGAT